MAGRYIARIPTGGEDVAYSDCDTFYELNNRGCHGWNTVDMNRDDGNC